MANTALTFLDLQNRFLRWIDEAAGTAASTSALAQDAINASHRRILAKRLWPFMKWPRVANLTTVTNQRAYALHPQCDRLLYIYDTDRKIYIPLLSRREWPSVGVDAAGTNLGTAVYGAILGTQWPVQAQPSVAAALTLVSSNAADTGCQVYLEGEDGGGNFQTEAVTLNGLTPVTTVNSYLWITAKTKIGTFLGTLMISSGSTVLETLAASNPGQWYPTLEFVEGPQGGRNMIYSFQRVPRTLVNDNDLPDIPYPWSEILVYDALLDLTTYNTELGEKEQSLWKARYDDLMGGLLSAEDEGIAGSYPRFVRDLDASGPSNRVWNYAP